jgi:hypothetical protein
MVLLGSAAITLLGRRLHYTFMDPQTHLEGLVVSYIISGIVFGSNMQAPAIAQAKAAALQGQITTSAEPTPANPFLANYLYCLHRKLYSDRFQLCPLQYWRFRRKCYCWRSLDW